jgi:hypothetical protein
MSKITGLEWSYKLFVMAIWVVFVGITALGAEYFWGISWIF